MRTTTGADATILPPFHLTCFHNLGNFPLVRTSYTIADAVLVKDSLLLENHELGHSSMSTLLVWWTLSDDAHGPYAL
ncbi:hypothetical protein AHF37_00300 [Paragonimus kellicotti]|nr:hypothetical protein AHF37_00300 [Paragonimus kellicotti]